MGLFKFKWLRRYVRHNTRPIPMHSAQVWKNRLSVAYMLLGWNAFGLVCYMCYKGAADWPKYYGLKSDHDMKISPGRQFAKSFGMENATIIRLSGLQYRGSVDITKEDFPDEEEEDM